MNLFGNILKVIQYRLYNVVNYYCFFLGLLFFVLLFPILSISLASVYYDIPVMNLYRVVVGITCWEAVDNIGGVDTGLCFRSPSMNWHHGGVESIDVVYTWVNGSDPVWFEEMSKFKREYLASQGMDLNVNQNSDDPGNRFRDNDELRFSLRSLFKYAPWVRRIYIVTNGQVPEWLNEHNRRVKVVTHAEIFENTTVLPVFASPAIETQIHRIPGLSRQFIYFNDDVFLGKPVYPSDFYNPSEGASVYLSWEISDCAKECIYPGVEYVPLSGLDSGKGKPTYLNSGLGRAYDSISNTPLGDGVCDRRCNSRACFYDAGDCLYDILRDEDQKDPISYLNVTYSNEYVDQDVIEALKAANFDFSTLQKGNYYKKTSNSPGSHDFLPPEGLDVNLERCVVTAVSKKAPPKQALRVDLNALNFGDIVKNNDVDAYQSRSKHDIVKGIMQKSLQLTCDRVLQSDSKVLREIRGYAQAVRLHDASQKNSSVSLPRSDSEWKEGLQSPDSFLTFISEFIPENFEINNVEDRADGQISEFDQNGGLVDAEEEEEVEVRVNIFQQSESDIDKGGQNENTRIGKASVVESLSSIPIKPGKLNQKPKIDDVSEGGLRGVIDVDMHKLPKRPLTDNAFSTAVAALQKLRTSKTSTVNLADIGAKASSPSVIVINAEFTNSLALRPALDSKSFKCKSTCSLNMKDLTDGLSVPKEDVAHALQFRVIPELALDVRPSTFDHLPQLHQELLLPVLESCEGSRYTVRPAILNNFLRIVQLNHNISIDSLFRFGSDLYSFDLLSSKSVVNETSTKSPEGYERLASSLRIAAKSFDKDSKRIALDSFVTASPQNISFSYKEERGAISSTLEGIGILAAGELETFIQEYLRFGEESAVRLLSNDWEFSTLYNLSTSFTPDSLRYLEAIGSVGSRLFEASPASARSVSLTVPNSILTAKGSSETIFSVDLNEILLELAAETWIRVRLALAMQDCSNSVISDSQSLEELLGQLKASNSLESSNDRSQFPNDVNANTDVISAKEIESMRRLLKVKKEGVVAVCLSARLPEVLSKLNHNESILVDSLSSPLVEFPPIQKVSVRAEGFTDFSVFSNFFSSSDDLGDQFRRSLYHLYASIDSDELYSVSQNGKSLTFDLLLGITTPDYLKVYRHLVIPIEFPTQLSPGVPVRSFSPISQIAAANTMLSLRGIDLIDLFSENSSSVESLPLISESAETLLRRFYEPFGKFEDSAIANAVDVSEIVKYLLDGHNVSSPPNQLEEELRAGLKLLFSASSLSSSESQENKARRLDEYAQSLLFTSLMISSKLGRRPKYLPAHMPHMIDRDVIARLHRLFPTEFSRTASHRFRSPTDVQFSLSYFFFLAYGGNLAQSFFEVDSTPDLRNNVQISSPFFSTLGASRGNMFMREFFENEVDSNRDGKLSDAELDILLALIFGEKVDFDSFHSFWNCVDPEGKHHSVRTSEKVSQNFNTGSENIDTSPSIEASSDDFSYKLEYLSWDTVSSCSLVTDAFTRMFMRSKDSHGADATASSFVMLTDDARRTIRALNLVLQSRPKFICLNDDMKLVTEETVLALGAFFEAYYPLPSPFEHKYDVFSSALNKWYNLPVLIVVLLLWNRLFRGILSPMSTKAL